MRVSPNHWLPLHGKTVHQGPAPAFRGCRQTGQCRVRRARRTMPSVMVPERFRGRARIGQPPWRVSVRLTPSARPRLPTGRAVCFPEIHPPTVRMPESFRAVAPSAPASKTGLSRGDRLGMWGEMIGWLLPESMSQVMVISLTPPGAPVRTYMRSGTSMPSRSSPRSSVRRVTALSDRREVRTAISSSDRM